MLIWIKLHLVMATYEFEQFLDVEPLGQDRFLPLKSFPWLLLHRDEGPSLSIPRFDHHAWQKADASVSILENDLSEFMLTIEVLQKNKIVRENALSFDGTGQYFECFRSLVVGRGSTSGNSMTSSLIQCSSKAIAFFLPQERVREG